MVITGFFVTACENRKLEEIPHGKPSLIIGDQFNYGIDSILLFPIGCSYKPEISGEIEKANSSKLRSFGFKENNSNFYDMNAQKEFVNRNQQDFDIRNILFHDLDQNTSFPLTEDSLHILSFGVHYEFERNLIFYRVVKKDYNLDQIYNDEDAVALFTSDLYGKNFTQITAFSEKFVSYTYYEKSNSLMLKTIIDNNQDKIYSNTDETNFRSITLDSLGLAQNIFTDELKDKLRKQMEN